MARVISHAAAAAATGAAQPIEGGAPGRLRGPLSLPTRRDVLSVTGWGTIALVCLQALVAFLAYFWPRKRGVFGTSIGAGAPEDYALGDVRHFVEGRCYVARVAEGFIALSQKCPHLGCTVPWRPAEQRVHEAQLVQGLFVCPCHGSTYLPNGQVIKGPAQRSLDYLPITLQRGRLVVDTGKPRKREKWDPSQALPA